ncbi:MAG: LysM peptidoglycan-binding domain-containing protein [Candidatus Methylomirabilales bacterium]
MFWGRLIVLGGLLLTAFVLGRASVRDAVPEARSSRSELAAIRRQLAEARAQVGEARAEIERLRTAATASPNPSPSPSPTPQASPTLVLPTPEARTYSVAKDDSFWKIAKKVYGDATLAGFLAKANNLDEKATLQVGQKILIPPKPSG